MSATFQDLQLAVTHVMSHPRLLDVVRELDNDPERLSSANQDPHKYLGTMGFQVPPEWTVQFSKNSPLTIRVCVNSHCVSVSVELV
ncbi:hypothetical protein ACF09C_11020 [Streptomyces sp. NPDC014870]|uniref:hypothetical protein n=1 Tax=Streptomyces sp. NPDC014870 TaxID=3364925 RepID=UPI0036FB949E